jgi:hypothetical protein
MENKRKQLGGNFGGKKLRGKFWREYFGVKFWGIFWRGGGDFGGEIFEGNYIFFGGGEFRGKRSLCML